MVADICLITEGTYPYVMGGVSTWIAQILDSMPHLRFSILHIGSSPDLPREVKYKRPPNLVEIRDAFLFDYPPPRRGHEVVTHEVLTPEEKQRLLTFYEDLTAGRPTKATEISAIVRRFADDREFTEAMAHSQSAWDVVTGLYKNSAPPGLSFLDFFWTVRALFMPVLNILRMSVPPARAYHAACTGYAGLLGARVAKETGRPFLLTEHGIYARERRIELSRIDWLSSSGASKFLSLDRSRNWFREWWIRLFQSLSRSAYDESARIVSLYQGNKDTQVREGARADIVDLIPNGIIVERFTGIQRQPRNAGDLLRIGFVGRVTSIKDIKTLLRAAAILVSRGVKFNLRIVGPMDEEPEYTDECLALAVELDLADVVVFAGPSTDLPAVYRDMDVMVMTSVSEGFPFVILEANCAGVPVVATNVGACREILAGMGKEDLALGPSGLATAVNAPEETADALERYARDPALVRRHGLSGRERAVRFYDLRRVMAQYQEMYETYMYAPSKPPFQEDVHFPDGGGTRILTSSTTRIYSAAVPSRTTIVTPRRLTGVVPRQKTVVIPAKRGSRVQW